MLVNLLVLVAISYILFVFASDLLNPLVYPKAPLKKRRFRFGRALALSSLLAGVGALSLLSLSLVSEKSAVVFYLAIISILATPAVVRYKKTAIWQH